MAEIASYLSAEAPIVARVEAQVRPVEPRLHVLTGPDLQSAKSSGQPTPAVHVVHYRDAVVDSNGRGYSSDITQTWLAVCVVDNVAGIRDGASAREDAGILGVLVWHALSGFPPAANMTPLEQVASPFSTSYLQGRMYLPLAFQTRFQLRRSI